VNIADYVVAFLASLGARHIYGYPGTPLVPLLAAMQRQDTVRWVLMRHENAAAMAAGAHGRLTGQLGVCVATSGPGALNAICGMVDADLDRVPALAITGLVPTAQEGHWEFQDVNQARLFASVLAHSAVCTHPNQLAALLRNFIGMAVQGQRAVHLALPSDLLETEIDADDPLFRLDTALMPRPLSLMPPPAPAIDVVAADLERYRLPVIVIGRRAVGCGPAIERLAEKLGAPIITALDGKGIVDESHPNALGVLGIFGYPAVDATRKILQEADVVLAIGVDTIKPFLTDDIDIQRRALIQCESEFSFLTHEYHRDRTLVGPLDAIVDGLRETIRARPPHPVLATMAAERTAFRREIAAASAAPEAADFLHPRDFLLPLSEALPSGAVVVLDTGVNTLWAAQYLQLTRRQRVIISSHLGTMGFSLPAAIAAQLAAPDSPVVAICGDGGFQMTVGELATAVHEELPLIVIVFNNGILQNVLAQQAVPYGTRLTNPDFVALAHAYGADGVIADASTDIPALLKEAFGTRRQRPMLIDLRVDPELMFPLSKWEHYAPSTLKSHRHPSGTA
jgi:thiamine pyrophosphate-dependent acetolactate synthase large subunit-like protein